MAALHICHCFHIKSSSSRQQFQPRNVISISCHNRESSNPLDAEEEGKKEKKESKRSLAHQVILSADKFGKTLRENLSPKQKGDWKDLTYMSLSFALYVYVSQKLVCAYCAWMSITKQPW